MKSQESAWLLEEKYDGVKNDAFVADCARLEAGEPLAYVIGWVPFLDCRIYLDSTPLIPRPETEYWTELAIAEIQKTDATTKRPLRILDLCAGSGAIGVAVAKALPTTHLAFAELDPAHLPTIERNLTKNLPFEWKVLEERLTVLESDLFAAVSDSYDFILTNPPYIDPVLDRAEAAVKAHEPHSALYGGEDGLELIAQIIATAPTHLNPGGQLWIEHEPEQAAAIARLGTEGGYTTTTHNDQYGQHRFSVLTMAH